MSGGPTTPRAVGPLRAARGAGWLYAHRWLERLLDFVALVVLARVLSPDDFGLVAIAASVVAILEGLAAFDVHKALIRSPDPDRALYDSAWTLGTLRGLVSALVLLSVTPLFTDPRLGPVLAALALGPLLLGVANPRFTSFERDLAYGRVALQTLSAKLVSFAVTVGIAFATRSYWALVVGALANSLLATALSYALIPYRPRLSLARAREIFGFSGWLSLTTAVTTLAMETDKLIVGKLLGIGDAGRYFMTQRVGVLPTRELVSPLQRLLFPSFSQLVDEPARLRRVVAESINVLGSLSLPAGCGFALVAADFVPIALGEQWVGIVPLLTILTPYLGARATLAIALPCVLALGRTRLLFVVSAVYALVHVPVFVVGTALFGLEGAIWSLVAAGIVYIGSSAWLLHATLGITAAEILARLRRPAAATAVMAATLLGLRPVLPLEEGSPGVLAGVVALGAAVYGVTLYLLWRAEGRPEGIERRLLQLRDAVRSSA